MKLYKNKKQEKQNEETLSISQDESKDILDKEVFEALITD